MTQLWQNAFRVLRTCLHGYPAILRIPSHSKEGDHIARSWYLRLKQIECYQAFRADDKEYRTDAVAFGISPGRSIGKSSSGGVSRVNPKSYSRHRHRTSHCWRLLGDNKHVITHPLKIYENYLSSHVGAREVHAYIFWGTGRFRDAGHFMYENKATCHNKTKEIIVLET